MSDRSTPAGKALVTRPDYEVGYGKPPKETRFQPGKSGNPKGRPKGAKNKRPAPHAERLKEIILDEAHRDISVRDGDRNVTIPMAQAIVRSMAVNAAKGQHRAQRLFAELLAATESSRQRLNEQWLETAIEYKIEWERELHRRHVNGITHLPDPLPHPDHVRIDMREGTVRIVGPMPPEEKAASDEVHRWRDALSADLEDAQSDRANTDDAEMITFLDEESTRTQRILSRIDEKLDP